MARYTGIEEFVQSLNPNLSEEDLVNELAPHLIDIWLDDYSANGSTSDIVETRASHFSYLFDIATQRLIAAWGTSQGKISDPRPKNIMKNFPLSEGPLYHRGHAIPHTLGGLTDINLVPQLGKINIGVFRILEKKAVATPGSFYFTYWTYEAAKPFSIPSQTPMEVDQGLIVPGKTCEIETYPN
jgi:hypothetical protein